MLWAILAITSGFFDAIALGFLKKLSGMNKLLLLLFRHLISLPFLLISLFFFGFPSVSWQFYFIVLLNSLTMAFGMYYSIKSLEISNLSNSVPIISFTPVFLILFSYIALGEIPTLLGIAGIFLVVFGSYILNLNTKLGIFYPFKSIFVEKGNLYMFFAALIFCFNAVLTKKGILLSNPAYFIFMNYIFLSAALIIILAAKFRNVISEAKSNLGNLMYLGVSTTIMELSYAVAVIYTIVPYAISLKRTSIIFSALIGITIFKEKNRARAIAGATIVFIGVAVIAVS